MSPKSALPRHVRGEWARTSRLEGVNDPANTRSYSFATTFGRTVAGVTPVPAYTQAPGSTTRRSAETGEQAYWMPTTAASGALSGGNLHCTVAALGSLAAAGSFIVR